MRYVIAILMIVSSGCSKSTGPADYRDVVAVDAAMATIDQSTVPTPSPAKCSRCGGTGKIIHGDGHETPCPDCTDGAAGPERTGPIDSIRQVKELVAKGNDIADRCKAILDAAEKQGGIDLTVKMPKNPSAQPPQHLPVPSPVSDPVTTQDGDKPEANTNGRPGCAGGACSVQSDGWYFGKRVGRRR